MERNQTIDVTKGLGVLLMLVGHMTGMVPIHLFIYQFHMSCVPHKPFLSFMSAGKKSRNSKIKIRQPR